MKNNYDSIVIGSGAGGMTAALALANAGQKVLLLEQHKIAGGWTHSFSKKGYKYNTGVHYVGDLHKGGNLRRIYEGLGVTNDLAFMELNPDAYDHIIIGEEKFDIPKGKENYKERLKERFPREKRGIDRFFARMAAMQKFSHQLNEKNWKYLLSHAGMFFWMLGTGEKVLRKYLKDPLLKGILSSQIGIHGMPPNRLSAPFMTGGIQHYFKGAYHPLGGGLAISNAFIKAFKKAGGEVMLNTEVTRILVDNNEVSGIELANGEQIKANSIVSNADPTLTYMKLVGVEHLNRKLRKKVANLSYSTSSISLFLAVDIDLKALGYDSGNYWLYDHADMNRTYDLAYTDHNVFKKPEAMFVTITTLKDPSKTKNDHHQLEVFTLAGYDAFRQWADKPKGDRGAEYEQLKNEITERMLDRLEIDFPGIRESIVFQELGTPLTNQHYVNAPLGNVYGIEKSVKQIGPGSFSVKTGIKGLYLCGASTIAHGIAPCTNSGLVAAAKVMSCSTSDLLSADGPELQIYPAEDPASWPERILK